MEGLALFVLTAVGERDFKSPGQESRLTQAHLQRIVIVDRFLKDAFIRKEGHLCAVLFRGTAPLHAQRIHGFSLFIALFVDFSVFKDLDLQPLGEGVYDRRAHAMQAAGNLISAAAEFSSCVQDGEYDFDCREARLFLDIDRYAASVILYGDGVVFIDLNLYLIAKAGQRLVHRIVYDLVYKMMEAPHGRTADIHSGSFSDRL